MPMLQGKTVTLREFRDTDLPVLAAIRNDVELQRALMAAPRPNSRERVEDWLQRRANDPQGAFFVVAVSIGDVPIGFLQLVAIDMLSRHADLGICLTPEQHGLGRATEALALLEGYASGVLGLRKIVLHVLANNARAIAFYERRGFRRVGVLSEHHYHRGEFHDVLIMEKRIDAPPP